MKKSYAFIGIQGSGKGTQAVLLAEALEYQHINIGDLLRYNVKNKTLLGAKVQSIIRKGELVPDDLVFEVIENKVSLLSKGVVFDGFPRTINQAEHLLRQFDLLRVFFLDLTEESAIERISARRVCQDCGENYNLNTQPPQIENVCDRCGGKLAIRSDDRPESIHRRFEEFYQQTSPLRYFFESHRLLSVIPAAGTIEEISRQILGLIMV